MDCTWFHELRRAIDNAKTEKDITNNKWRAAWRVMHKSTIGTVRLQAFHGFVSSEEDGSLFRYEGLTKKLEDLFHPLPLNISTGGARTGGSARGMAVDRELADLINKGEVPRNEPLHRYTQKTLLCLKEANLKPFWAQVPIGDRELKLATALDMLCIDTNSGGIVNVQLKTGYDLNYTKANGNFVVSLGSLHEDCKCEAIERMPDSHESRNLLQLIAENMLVQRNHKNILSNSVLMVISETEHKCYHLPPNMENIQRGIVNNLKRTNEGNELQARLESLRRQHAIKQIMKTKKKNYRMNNKKTITLKIKKITPK